MSNSAWLHLPAAADESVNSSTNNALTVKVNSANLELQQPREQEQQLDKNNQNAPSNVLELKTIMGD